MAKMSGPARLAKIAIEGYFSGSTIDKTSEHIPQELLQTRAGCFVCLKIQGELRGCMGTIEATKANLVEEIATNAVRAAIGDPRFEPVTREEAGKLEYSVDILEPPEEISSVDELDPKQYGVIVESGARRGLLLPDLEGVDTAEDQVDIARRKAAISPGKPLTLYRFRVSRYE